uniref:ORF64 n=1 Tax=Malaco herpesvirus 4 TaxID=3031800 RepID=A0AA48P7P7_9VIRU|nr:TPA_asm: ORF64 [Malaco herpesvirus 4]
MFLPYASNNIRFKLSTFFTVNAYTHDFEYSDAIVSMSARPSCTSSMKSFMVIVANVCSKLSFVHLFACSRATVAVEHGINGRFSKTPTVEPCLPAVIPLNADNKLHL